MNDIADLEREVFALEIDNVIAIAEGNLTRELQPSLERLLQSIDEMVAAGKEITDADLERMVAPLNDALAVGMGREMAGLQVPLRLEAERWAEVVPDGRAPFSDTGTLMRRAAMDGTSMTEWFRRESPSRWMRGVIDELRKGIQAGWEATRLVAMDAVSRLVTTAVESGLWSSGNGTLQRNWRNGDLTWYTRQDERVCPICRPLNGESVTVIGRRPPAHPRCRCVALPPRSAGSG